MSSVTDSRVLGAVRGMALWLALVLAGGIAAWGQSYWITTVAGRNRVREGEQAVKSPLRFPNATAVDRDGNLYIADSADNRIRKVSLTGVISTYAGTGLADFKGDGGPATEARLDNVRSIAIDKDGNLYLADAGNYRVRKITPSGTISTVIGRGDLFSSPNFSEGGPASASVITPEAVAVDGQGNLYVSDISTWVSIGADGIEMGARYAVRRIDHTGTVTTIVGGGPPLHAGDGGPASQARIGAVRGIVVDPAGVLYLADSTNNRVRRVSETGIITTIAGNGRPEFGGDGGVATQASLLPWGLALDSNGDLYVSDKYNSRVRRIDGRTGIITTVAGDGTPGFAGDGGPANKARLAFPSGLALDGVGNLFVSDSYNARVRKIARGGLVETVAGSGNGDGGPATQAVLNHPQGVALDAEGSVYVADTSDDRIRKVDRGGNISTVAGSGYSGFQDGEPRDARFRSPLRVAVGSDGAIYVADAANYRIRKITATAVGTIAGTGTKGFTGDGGKATGAQIGVPTSVAVDGSGNVYFTDYDNSRIRRVTPDGIISTIAGNGKWTFGGDGGPATAGQLDPLGMAIDRGGNIYVADYANNRIRKIDSAGTITTFAGGTSGFSGDGGPAAQARLNSPTGVAVDSEGAVYIADYDNYRVRKVNKEGIITTIGGNGGMTISGDGGLGVAAQLDPYEVAVDREGSVYVVDYFNERVRKLALRTAATLGVVSGDQRTGTAGQAIAEPLTVRVLDASGAGVAGVSVTFAVTAGTATLSPTQAITDANGLAKTNVTLGATAGEVRITAAVAGLTSVTFRITVLPAGLSINPGGVVGAGLSRPSVRGLSPNGLMTIFGSGFAADGILRKVSPEDLQDGRLPTRFAGVCVLVGETRAPIISVLATQITFQVPMLTPAPTADVRVATQCGTDREQRSNAESLPLQEAAPEFFYFLQRPDGTNPIAAVNAVTGQFIGSPGMLAGASFAPAKPGDVLTLYLTGLGQTDPNCMEGEFAPGPRRVKGAVTVIIGGATITAADLLYAGVTPQSPGLYQINLRLPDSVPDGDQSVLVSMYSVSSPAVGVLPIRRQ